MSIKFKITLSCDCCGMEFDDRDFDDLATLKEDADDEVNDLNQNNHTKVETLDCVYEHLCESCYHIFQLEGELV